MHSLRYSFFAVVLTIPLAAQTLTIGNDVVPGPPAVGGAAVHTVIDLAGPANATGNVTSVKYHWTAAGCANAVKIKFFHRAGQNFTMTAERGPFTSSLVETITLDPPVPVQQGDLIGLTRLTSCGTPLSSEETSDGFLDFSGDVTGTVVMSAALGQASHSLALYGTGTATERVVGVFAVVGSTRGGFDSNWKTALQIFNPSSGGTMTGKIVFRPEANVDGPFPSLPYSLGPRQMKAYEDVVAAMGRSGLGSLDLVVPVGQGEPIVSSRIYNDAGASGTAGLTQDLIRSDVTLKHVSRILRRGTTGYLFAPMKPAFTRLNIGVRALDAGARFDVTVRNDAGATVRTTTKSYAPNWFTQVSSTTFLGALAGNETIEITVTRGSVIIYGATTDNVTNDPAVQFACVEFSSGS